jgi:DNA-binding CsgD family transcriptional regulator
MPPSRTRRRKRAAALRGQGLTTRQIAARLGVSQPTVVRDLRAHRAAEAEAILAVLAGQPEPEPQPPAPRWLAVATALAVLRRPGYRELIRASRWQRYGTQRRADAAFLRDHGATLREIAAALGVSPATVLRDLRREQPPDLPLPPPPSQPRQLGLQLPVPLAQLQVLGLRVKQH